MKLRYNLQFFAEEEEIDDQLEEESDDTQVDVSALADLISEKDKEIQQLQQDMSELKKTNAKLLVMVNSGGNQNSKKTFEENLLELVGAKPRKE